MKVPPGFLFHLKISIFVISILAIYSCTLRTVNKEIRANLWPSNDGSSCTRWQILKVGGCTVTYTHCVGILLVAELGGQLSEF